MTARPGTNAILLAFAGVYLIWGTTFLGIALAIPLLWFAFRRRVPDDIWPRLIGLLVLLGVQDSNDRFSIFRHFFFYLDSIRRLREHARDRVAPSGEQLFTLGGLHFRIEHFRSLDDRVQLIR